MNPDFYYNENLPSEFESFCSQSDSFSSSFRKFMISSYDFTLRDTLPSAIILLLIWEKLALNMSCTFEVTPKILQQPKIL